MTALLEISDLRVAIGPEDMGLLAVRGMTLTVDEGETLVIVGESGSGKSVCLLAAMRLMSSAALHVVGGEVRFRGQDTLAMPLHAWRKLQGREIGMVFQDALASLNPVYTVGWQIAEKLRLQGHPRRAAARMAVELMAQVGIPDPARRAKAYPHQLSGGTRQRIMIAIALASDPALVICDEPTTALDATIQAQILDVLRRMRDDRGMAMIMVTHDLAVASEIADRIAVVYAGRVVESGPAEAVLFQPLHPYTRALLAAAPQDDPEAQIHAIPGAAPNPAEIAAGCLFAPRCGSATSLCRETTPPPVGGADHLSFCHHPERVEA